MTYAQLKKKLAEIRSEITSAFVARNHGAMIACLDRIEALYESAGSALLGRSNRGKKIAVTEASLAARRANGAKGGRPKNQQPTKPINH